MYPKISIIIPYYNVNEFLFDNCIKSVLNQTFKDYELLIVNDGSDSNFHEYLERISRSDKRIKILNKHNGGVSTARNYGTAEAIGDYITYIDADDTVSNDFLENAYKIITESSVDFVIGAMKCITNINTVNTSNDINKSNLSINNYTIYNKENFTTLIPSLIASNKMIRFSNGSFINRGPCSRLIKTSIAKKCLFPVGIALGEDMIWNQIVLQKCNTLAISDNIWYFYLKNETSASHKYSPNSIKLIQDFHNTLYEKVDITNDKIYTALCSKFFEDIRTVICINFLTNKKNKTGFLKKWKTCNELKNKSPWTNITLRYIKFCNIREKIIYFLFKTGLLFPLAYLKDRLK